MAENYIVIYECTAFYDEYTLWKIVRECLNPADAIVKTEFVAPISHPEDHALYVIRLPEDIKQEKFEPEEELRQWKEVN